MVGSSVFWLLGCCGVVVFVESGVEILSDRAAAVLSCLKADDNKERKKRKEETTRTT